MSETRSLRILLVEDNPGDAKLVLHMLRDAPADLRIAPLHVESLDAALKVLAAERFDAVLLDLSLPDSTGLDTVHRVVQASPTLPIVVLTGLDDSEVGLEAVQAGAQDYLVKGHGDGKQLSRTLLYAEYRKESQITIERLSRRNDLILRSLGEGVIGCDAQGRITFLNPALKAMTGYGDADLLGRSPHDSFHPLTGGQTSPILATLADGQVRDVVDIDIRHAQGRTVPAELIVTPMQENGRIVGAVAAYHDVTDRQHAFDTLRHQLEFQQTVIDSLPLALFYLDRAGVLIGANTAFEKLIGKGRSQLLGYPADEVLPPALAELVEALEQSSLTPVAVTLVDGQGRKRAGHVRFRHFNAPDRGPGGVVGILVENGGE